jgi:hypothetical protein
LIGPKLYVAQIPIGSSDDVAFGAGKVVIDRPFLTFRTPYFVDESMYWMSDNARKLGRRVKTSVSNLLNSDSQEFFLDKYVDIGSALGSGSSGSNSDLGKANGDNTIYRTLKGDIDLEGDANLTPSDGFRQDQKALEAEVEAEMRQKMSRQKRRRAPSAGRSLRPRYGHLYR